MAPSAPPTCVKCRTAPAQAQANQTEALCGGCLRSSLLHKFKNAVNQNKLVENGDSVLLAFSGGHSSRVLLDFLQGIQARAPTAKGQGSDARGRIPFRLGAVFVDERTVTGVPPQQADEYVRVVLSVLQQASAAAAVPLAVHIVRLEDVFASTAGAGKAGLLAGAAGPSAAAGAVDVSAGAAAGAVASTVVATEAAAAVREEVPGSLSSLECQTPMQGEVRASHERVLGGCGLPHQLPSFSGGRGSECNQLLGLLEKAPDSTMREDTVEALRMELIQQVAGQQGYSKVALGTSTSRVAWRVLADVAKGRGFSLPASVHYYDARHAWRVPVLQPLRDCVVEELALHCCLSRLRTVFVPNVFTDAAAARLQSPTSLAAGRSRPAGRPRSVNSAAADFAVRLQRENASRQHTITRTALKLQPFEFNATPAIMALHRQQQQQQQQQKQKEPPPPYVRSINRLSLSRQATPTLDVHCSSGTDLCCCSSRDHFSNCRCSSIQDLNLQNTGDTRTPAIAAAAAGSTAVASLQASEEAATVSCHMARLNLTNSGATQSDCMIEGKAEDSCEGGVIDNTPLCIICSGPILVRENVEFQMPPPAGAQGRLGARGSKADGQAQEECQLLPRSPTEQDSNGMGESEVSDGQGFLGKRLHPEHLHYLMCRICCRSCGDSLQAAQRDPEKWLQQERDHEQMPQRAGGAQGSDKEMRSLLAGFVRSLPQTMRTQGTGTGQFLSLRQWERSQIEDFLLSDEDEEDIPV